MSIINQPGIYVCKGDRMCRCSDIINEQEMAWMHQKRKHRQHGQHRRDVHNAHTKRHCVQSAADTNTNALSYTRYMINDNRDILDDVDDVNSDVENCDMVCSNDGDTTIDVSDERVTVNNMVSSENSNHDPTVINTTYYDDTRDNVQRSTTSHNTRDIGPSCSMSLST